MHYTTDYRNYKEGASYQYRPRYQHSKRYSFDFTNQETSSKHYGTVHMLTLADFQKIFKIPKQPCPGERS